MWSDFLDGKSVAGTTPWNLLMPDGTSIPVDLSSTPSYRLGRHLAIILLPAERALDERLDRAVAPTSDALTKREREVLTLVALGNTGVGIARQLFLSPATVATHVVNALSKLGAKNRAHGITLALQRLTRSVLQSTGLGQAAVMRPSCLAAALCGSRPAAGALTRGYRLVCPEPPLVPLSDRLEVLGKSSKGLVRH